MDEVIQQKVGSLPSFLAKENLKFILFGGKGGVGKTTSATSSAIYLARSRPHKKILVFSTDPAHSLSDSFDQTIADEPVLIQGFQNLYAVEMNFRKVYEDYAREYEFELIELAERSSYFGIKHMSNASAILSYPTSFEFMVMIKLIELSKSKEYDIIVIDTAPTGHTLMLLQILAGISDQFKSLERSQTKHRYMMTRYYGRYKKDRVDKFLDKMKSEVERLQKILTGNRSEFVVVTIAEEMSIWESKRLLRALRKRDYQIPNRNIIVNGLSPSSQCPLCASRKKEEQRYLVEIREEFPEHNIIRIPLFPYEINGERLNDYALYLEDQEKFNQASFASLKEPTPPAYVEVSELWKPSLLDPLNGENRKIILFGGKGGVGKTTSAASTAVHLARVNAHKKVLVFSTDPAHSLADSFDLPIGDNISLIEGFHNLYGLQIDLEKRLEQFKKEYKAKIKEAFKPEVQSRNTVGSNTQSAVSYPFDEDMVSNLVDLAPLGLDEIMALSDVILEKSSAYDVIIIDTAPTGHLVKLLQKPQMVLRWFTQIIQGLKTYSGMMKSTFEVTKELLGARKEIMMTHKILMDNQRTEFVVVTIAESMGIYETERLVRDLQNLKMTSRFIIANKIVSENECSYCSSKRAEQSKRMQQIRTKFPNIQVVKAPLFPHEIRGVKRLEEFANFLYGSDNRSQRTEDRMLMAKE